MHKLYITLKRGSSASQTIFNIRILLKVSAHDGRCMPSLHSHAFAANPALTKIIHGCSHKGYAEQKGKYYDASQNLALGTRFHIHRHTRVTLTLV